ncbi:MAG TPA: protein translocase subunit SecF [Stellaceae bacterium]|jgi:preprotein translocase subunit SecF
MKPLRLVPDNTNIRFMRGRYAGLIVSAILSTLSIVLFFYPGLNYSIDFKGGSVIELRMAQPTHEDDLRAVFEKLPYGEARVQEFGSNTDFLVRLDNQITGDNARQQIEGTLGAKFPGIEIRRLEAVGAQVSGELFRAGLMAVGLSFVGVLIYIWFRFDWQFGVGVVGTLLLDITKTIGFFAVTRIPFDLNSVAAIMLLIGYSVTDKIVVYDRIRENLRRFKTMPLREVIDMSINQTLSRTVATSLTVLLSIVPLAVLGAESIHGFALTIIFGIVVGTSSSIFIASPILLFLGQRRLRPELYKKVEKVAAPA